MCKIVIVALFFADDGRIIIIMQSLKETIDSIKILTDIAQDCGLSINKAKINILIYNSKEQPDHIEVMLYADDITITSTHTSMSAARKYIQPYLHKVYRGCASRSPEASQTQIGRVKAICDLAL